MESEFYKDESISVLQYNKVGKKADACCSLRITDGKQHSPKIPDGGWGWMVVLADLIISMIADGTCFSFGLLYIELLDEFGASNSATSWIGSLFISVPLISGPISSALVDRYGCRTMTIMSGIVSAIGFIISSYAKSLTIMYITFGVMSGLGLGVCYVTIVVSVAYWFDKKRNLAVGLAACGTGIGTFVYAPMTQYFISEYGWRGTVLLLAGCFLNICVCGAVMRQPEWLTIEKQNKGLSTRKRSMKRDSKVIFTSKDKIESDTGKIQELITNNKDRECILPIAVSSMDTNPSKEEISSHNFQSEVNFPTIVKGRESDPSSGENDPLKPRIDQNSIKGGTTLLTNSSRKPLQIEAESFINKNTKLRNNRLMAWSCPNICRSSPAPQGSEEKWYLQIIDFSLFLDFHFLILNVSTVLFYTWFMIPYFYIAEHLTMCGYTESEASHFISVIGIANTIGMIVLGWAGDQPWLNVTKAYAVCLIFCGISTAAMILFTDSYILLLLSTASFGLFLSSNFAFTPAIIIDIISLNKFTNAYGLILLTQGIGNLLGPPIAGFLYDLTGNLEQSFWQAGSWIVVAGVLLVIIPATKNRKLCSSPNNSVKNVYAA